MATFEEAFNRQQKLLPQVKRILATNLADRLISEAPLEEDLYRNTDLMVLQQNAVRIGCRIRTNKDYPKYWHQITIRSSRPSGVETEYQKILRGWGDYFFYGWESPDGSRIIAWTIGDLSEFRIWHSRYLATHNGSQPGMEKSNWDGSSTFRYYRLNTDEDHNPQTRVPLSWDLPPQFIVARHEPFLIRRQAQREADKRRVDDQWDKIFGATNRPFG